MLDCLLEGLLDTLKVLPYLFIAFLILEFIEHKLSKKNNRILTKNRKYGPIVGGILGAIPQCGFSTMAASLYSSRVITMGTVIAVFLSTSDEMLPIMISEQANIGVVLKIIGFKLIVGVIVGIIVDLIYRSKSVKITEHVHHMCEEEHCDCKHDGIFLSSLKHALKIGLFILIANLAINLIIYGLGEETVTSILMHKNILTYFLARLIGLIPNCASSVIITKLYLSNLITVGTLLSGLLTGSGIGILLLFKSNKNMKENLTILSIIYFVGVILGMVVDLII